MRFPPNIALIASYFGRVAIVRIPDANLLPRSPRPNVEIRPRAITVDEAKNVLAHEWHDEPEPPNVEELRAEKRSERILDEHLLNYRDDEPEPSFIDGSVV